ncbi:MAG: helix-turn-helix transcriptional regulator [Bacteroidales bacterium]|nr:helix-turn-helix transcriptional regulator [Bacteroidales bacterium]
MEDSVLERVKYLIDVKRLSVLSLSEIIGMPQTTVNNYILGKRRISLEFIEKIISSFGDVNPNWLLTGKGNAFDSPNEKQIAITGGSGNIAGNIGGSNMGNTYNFAPPPHGFQKIIDGDGNVEIYQSDSNILKELNELKIDNALLKQQVEHLTEKVEWVTKSKDEIIETLRGQLEQFSHSIDK